MAIPVQLIQHNIQLLLNGVQRQVAINVIVVVFGRRLFFCVRIAYARYFFLPTVFLIAAIGRGIRLLLTFIQLVRFVVVLLLLVWTPSTTMLGRTSSF